MIERYRAKTTDAKKTELSDSREREIEIIVAKTNRHRGKREAGKARQIVTGSTSNNP